MRRIRYGSFSAFGQPVAKVHRGNEVNQGGDLASKTRVPFVAFCENLVARSDTDTGTTVQCRRNASRLPRGIRGDKSAGVDFNRRKRANEGEDSAPKSLLPSVRSPEVSRNASLAAFGRGERGRSRRLKLVLDAQVKCHSRDHRGHAPPAEGGGRPLIHFIRVIRGKKLSS